MYPSSLSTTHRVGCGDLLELLRGHLVPARSVRVVLHGQLLVGRVDLLLGGSPRHLISLTAVHKQSIHTITVLFRLGYYRRFFFVFVSCFFVFVSFRFASSSLFREGEERGRGGLFEGTEGLIAEAEAEA